MKRLSIALILCMVMFMNSVATVCYADTTSKHFVTNNSSISVIDEVISNSKVTTAGAAIDIYKGYVNEITNSQFKVNNAQYGGAIYNYGVSTLGEIKESLFEGNYANILYPQANLKSQRISEFLASCGSDEVYRSFFKMYYPYISGGHSGGENILIDSTGLPNSIHFPLTAISSHNGKISNEVRLIYVTQQETGLPIYFRYCPGNVIDVSTLVSTIKELKQNGVDTKFAILDAGYYSEENIRKLYYNKISFITRLPEKLSLYKELIDKHLNDIQKKENFVNYNDRYVYIKCVEVPDVVDENKGYAYIGLDLMRKDDEDRKLFRRAKEQKISTDEVYSQMGRHGVFVILSSRKIAVNKILPTYYTRQQIEQIFDIGKNYADMLPLRVQNEDTFRGHLLLTFISCVILKMIQDKLLKTKYNPISMFMNLRNQKCKVYDKTILPTEPTKKMNDCYKLFKIKCPVEIP